MKASEAFLLAVQLAGGVVTPAQVSNWMTQLEQIGLLELIYYEDATAVYSGVNPSGSRQTPGQPIRCHKGEFSLTDAAVQFLKRKGYET